MDDLLSLCSTCREVKNAVQNEKGTTIHSTSFSILSRTFALDKYVKTFTMQIYYYHVPQTLFRSCKGIGAALETGGDKCIGSLLQHFRDETNELVHILNDLASYPAFPTPRFFILQAIKIWGVERRVRGYNG